MKRTAVRVLWHDAISYDGWHELADIDEVVTIPTVESVGFLVRMDKASITLALSYDPVGEKFSQYLLLPRKMIKSIEYFEPQSD